jgi:Flp pilus assembly protein TadB
MGKIQVFIIRAILAGVFAVLISRFFFQERPLFKVVILALALLGFAYLFEYLRKRDRGGNS